MHKSLRTSCHYENSKASENEFLALKNKEEREKLENKRAKGRINAKNFRDRKIAIKESLERDIEILQQRNNQIRFRSNAIKNETAKFINIAQSLISGHSCFTDFHNNLGQILNVLRERLNIPVYGINDQQQQTIQQSCSDINSITFFPPQSSFLSLPNRNVENFVGQLQYRQKQQRQHQLKSSDFNNNIHVSSESSYAGIELSFDSPGTPICEEQNKCESKPSPQRPTGLTLGTTWGEPTSTESPNDGKPQFDEFFEKNFPLEHEREMKKYAELKLQ